MGAPVAASLPSRSRVGFTLLEVLVAVGVLALLYTVLAGAAMQGLRAEGESARELRASLLADRVLAELEPNLEVGIVPPVGREEREEEDYVVEVEVSALELALPARGPIEKGERDARTPSLLGGSRGAAGPLRRVEVRVAWSEGLFEREVRRTSFGLDAEAAAPFLEGLAASQEADAEQQAPDDDDADMPAPRTGRNQPEVGE